MVYKQFELTRDNIQGTVTTKLTIRFISIVFGKDREILIYYAFSNDFLTDITG